MPHLALTIYVNGIEQRKHIGMDDRPILGRAERPGERPSRCAPREQSHGSEHAPISWVDLDIASVCNLGHRRTIRQVKHSLLITRRPPEGHLRTQLNLNDDRLELAADARRVAMANVDQAPVGQQPRTVRTAMDSPTRVDVYASEGTDR